MTDQIGITNDELQMVFTEHGLATAIASALDALEGGPDTAERANEIAQNIFLAATIEHRSWAGDRGPYHVRLFRCRRGVLRMRVIPRGEIFREPVRASGYVTPQGRRDIELVRYQTVDRRAEIRVVGFLGDFGPPKIGTAPWASDRPEQIRRATWRRVGQFPDPALHFPDLHDRLVGRSNAKRFEPCELLGEFR